MSGLLSNFRNTIIVSFVLALVIVIGYSHGPQGHGEIFLQAVFRWLHVMFGILWIGLLYYFNFVQIRVMPSIPGDLKPAVANSNPQRACSRSQTTGCGPVHSEYDHPNRKRRVPEKDRVCGVSLAWTGAYGISAGTSIRMASRSAKPSSNVTPHRWGSVRFLRTARLI